MPTSLQLEEVEYMKEVAVLLDSYNSEALGYINLISETSFTLSDFGNPFNSKRIKYDTSIMEYPLFHLTFYNLCKSSGLNLKADIL